MNAKNEICTHGVNSVEKERGCMGLVVGDLLTTRVIDSRFYRVCTQRGRTCKEQTNALSRERAICVKALCLTTTLEQEQEQEQVFSLFLWAKF